MKRNLLILLCILLLPAFVNAQRWKKTRYEVLLGLGTSNFMGELGGGYGDARHFFGVRDVDFATTRPVVDLGFRYKLYENLALRFNIVYATISAEDKYSGSPGRQSRNLSFKSNVFETSTQFEVSIIKEPIGTRYQRQRFKGLQKYGVNVYLFVGIGYFHFNPKTKADDGVWYELQPLGTEGQGIIDSVSPRPPRYKLWETCYPMGIGFKYSIDKSWSIGFEIGNRYTSTDYIDDASTGYYNNEKIRQHNTDLYGEYVGTIAAQLADRHLVGEGETWKAYPEQPGNMPPRGNPNYNDSYIFMMVNLVYKMKTSRGGLPKF